ncbi:MAG: hypothetical protein ACK5U4_09325, partial [Rhodospirillales bacterium]
MKQLADALHCSRIRVLHHKAVAIIPHRASTRKVRNSAPLIAGGLIDKFGRRKILKRRTDRV